MFISATILLGALGHLAVALPHLSSRQENASSPFMQEASIMQPLLEAHNKARALHGVPPLNWSSEAAKFAQDHLPNCEWHHTPDLQKFNYGENIAIDSRGNITEMVLNAWYNEIRMYDYHSTADLPPNFHDIGHFTQIVWKTTTEVGCAVRNCPYYEGAPLWGPFLKCNYREPGNFMGQFNNKSVPYPISMKIELFPCETEGGCADSD